MIIFSCLLAFTFNTPKFISDWGITLNLGNYDTNEERRKNPWYLNYLLKTALNEIFIGILAITDPSVVACGSVIWHFIIGKSLTVSSFFVFTIT